MKKKKRKKKKNVFLEIRYIIMIIFLLLFILGIALIVEYNIEQKKKEETKTTNVVKESYAFLLNNDGTLIETNDFIAKQEKVDNEINELLNNKTYSLDNPYILINPYGNNPLSAYIVFNTSDSTNVSVTIKGKNNDDITLKYSSDTKHIIPVYYLYPNYDNKVIITLGNGKTKELTISIKEQISNQNVITGSISKMIYVGGENVIAYDTYGNPRLKFNISINEKIKLLRNGNILISTDNSGTSLDNRSGLLEINQMGKIIHAYYIKNAYHDEVYENEEGDLYVLSTNNLGNNLVSVVNRSTGEVTKEYDIYSILSLIDTPYKEDLGINSITIKDDLIILSLKNLNSIISIDLNGELRWIYGSINNWSSSFRKYMLTKSSYLTKFIQGSTSINYKDNYLYILDNMYDAYNNPELDCNTYKNSNSYLRIYSINERYKNIKAIKNIKLNNYSYDSSSVDINDTILVSLGNVIDDSVDVNNYECTSSTNEEFKTEVIELDTNGNTLFNMLINYESENSILVSIPTEEMNYTLTKSTRTYSLINQSYEILDDNTVANYKSSEGLNVSIEYLNNHLKIDRIFDKSSKVTISLLDISGYAYEFNYKDANNYQNNYIDISLIKDGKYFIYLNIDGIVYNINRYIVK